MRHIRCGAITLAGIVALSVLVMSAVSTTHAQTTMPAVTYPGQATIPSNTYVTFQAPPDDPAGPLQLIVLNQSNPAYPAVQASYDGATLTLTAPAGYTILPIRECDTVAETATCHVAPTLQSGPILFFTILAPGEQPPGPQCAIVSFPLAAGWNIVAGSPNLHGVDGPFYTLQNGQYVVVPQDQLELGTGYLIYLDQAATVTAEYPGGKDRACSFPEQRQRERPAPCQWVMMGNVFAGRLDIIPAPNIVSPEYAPPWLHNLGSRFGLGAGQGRFVWIPCPDEPGPEPVVH